MKNYLLFLLFLFPFSVFAQNPNIKRTWHWYFGIHAGIDFSSGVAVADTNGQINTSEGCASISDTCGYLLFYTDGKTIWNKNHQAMPNGIGLMGGINGSSTQAALILPQPGSPNLFYLFTADEYPGTDGMRYSVIDMNLNGGNGDVDILHKNVLLFAPCTEKLSAVNHVNDTDIWIAGHKSGSNEFFCYLLTSQGLDTIPEISPVGSFIDISQGVTALAGQLKFSSDGKKAATTSSYQNSNLNGAELFDFNNQSGVFSNSIVLFTVDTFTYGVEFSFNNQYLYSSTLLGKLSQYDISSNDSALIVNSKIIIKPHSVPAFQYGLLQKSHDGKIYLANPYYSKVSVISQTDSSGLSCNLIDTNLYLGSGTHKGILGLPNFNCSYFKSLATNYCTTAIFEIKSNDETEVFPNPARDWILVRVRGMKRISIYNVFGNLIYSIPVADSYPQRLNVSAINKGVYFLKIETGTKNIVKKIIIN